MKFGFEDDNGLFILEDESFRCSLLFHDIWTLDITDKITDDETYHRGYYHVHQLQNLYFVLTGEELTIK